MALPEISTILGTLKTLGEISKSIFDMAKNADLKEKVMRLQNNIVSLQSDIISIHAEYGKLLQVKNDLEKKLMEHEDWDKTKSQYELKEPMTHIFVYAPKENSDSSEPEHWLCTKCFDDDCKKSILQLVDIPKMGHHFFCPRCKTKIPAYFEQT